MGNNNVRQHPNRSKQNSSSTKEVRRMRSFTPNKSTNNTYYSTNNNRSQAPGMQSTKSARNPMQSTANFRNQRNNSEAYNLNTRSMAMPQQKSLKIASDYSSSPRISPTNAANSNGNNLVNSRIHQQPSAIAPLSSRSAYTNASPLPIRSTTQPDVRSMSPISRPVEPTSKLVNIVQSSNPLQEPEWLENQKIKRRKDRERSFLGRNTADDNSLIGTTFEKQMTTFSRKKNNSPSKQYTDKEKDFMQSMAFASNYRLCAPLFAGPPASLVQLSLMTFDQSLLEETEDQNLQTNTKQKQQQQQPQQTLTNYLRFISDLETNAVQAIDFVDIAQSNKNHHSHSQKGRRKHGRIDVNNNNYEDTNEYQEITSQILSEIHDQRHHHHHHGQIADKNKRRNQASPSPGLRVQCNDTSHHNHEHDDDEEYIDVSHSQINLKVPPPKQSRNQHSKNNQRSDPFPKNTIESRPNGFSNVSSIVMNSSSANEIGFDVTPKARANEASHRSKRQPEPLNSKRNKKVAHESDDGDGDDYQTTNGGDSSPVGFGIKASSQEDEDDQWNSDRLREKQHNNITKALAGRGESNKGFSSSHRQDERLKKNHGDYFDGSNVISDIARIEEEENLRAIAWKHAEQEYMQEQRKAEIERMLLGGPKSEQSKRSNFQEHTEKQARLNELADLHLALLQKERSIRQRVEMYSEATIKRQEEHRQAMYPQYQPQSQQKQKNVNQPQMNTAKKTDKYVTSYQGDNTYSSKHKEKKAHKSHTQPTGIQIVKRPLFNNGGDDYDDDSEDGNEMVTKNRESVYQTGYYKDKEQEIVSLITSNNMFRPPGAPVAPVAVSNAKAGRGYPVGSSKSVMQLGNQAKKEQVKQNTKSKTRKQIEEEDMLRVMNESAINKLDVFQDFEDVHSEEDNSQSQQFDDSDDQEQQHGFHKQQRQQHHHANSREQQQTKNVHSERQRQDQRRITNKPDKQFQKRKDDSSAEQSESDMDDESVAGAANLLNEIKKQVVQLSGRIRTDQQELDSSIISYTQRINQQQKQFDSANVSGYGSSSNTIISDSGKSKKMVNKEGSMKAEEKKGLIKIGQQSSKQSEKTTTAKTKKEESNKQKKDEKFGGGDLLDKINHKVAAAGAAVATAKVNNSNSNQSQTSQLLSPKGGIPVFNKALSEYEYSGISSYGGNPISKTLVIEKESRKSSITSSIGQQLKERREIYESSRQIAQSNQEIEINDKSSQQQQHQKPASMRQFNEHSYVDDARRDSSMRQSEQAISNSNTNNNPLQLFHSNTSISQARDSFQFEHQLNKSSSNHGDEHQEQGRRSSELFNFFGVGGDASKQPENDGTHNDYQQQASNDSDDEYEYKDVGGDNQATNTGEGFDFGAFGDDSDHADNDDHDYQPAKIHIDMNRYKRN